VAKKSPASERIERARTEIMDLEAVLRAMLENIDRRGRLRTEGALEDIRDYDEPEPAFIEDLADRLKYLNWEIHGANGDVKALERAQRGEVA